jgi:3-(3-hydroxy-phenyl)propionate hydroxylase
VLLAGDAAHLMPPFAGQGLNAGLRDAANLAWKVAAVVNGTGTDALLDTYEAERLPHARDMVRLSRRIGQVVMSTRPAVNLLRDATVNAIGIVPSWKRWLTGMKFLKQPHFTAGCVVPADVKLPPAARELVGRSLSQPQVRLPSGAEVGLDEVIGNGWALLSPADDGSLGVIALPDGTDNGQQTLQTLVSEQTGAFAAAAGGHILVRPDRYVAAVFTASAAAATLAHLAKYSSIPARLLTAPPESEPAGLRNAQIARDNSNTGRQHAT